MPKLIFLGTGTSCGVPQIGCQCEVCKSKDKRDKRLRTSALYQLENGKQILLDCGPDFRQQILPLPFRPINGVLITHEHYDHVGGLDDLRPFSYKKDVDVYASVDCVEHIKKRMPYCFVENKYPGVPMINLHAISDEKIVRVGGIDVQIIHVMHGMMPILAYRIGDIAYITDMSCITDEEKEKLEGIKIMIVNALRKKPHHSHQSLDEALKLISDVRPQQSYLIHMSHEMGLHEEVENTLPQHVHLAYDGLEIAW